MGATQQFPGGLSSRLVNGGKTIYDVTEIKPYNLTELCRIYGVSDKTLIKWLTPFLEEIGPKLGRFYTVLQVEIIFYKLGMPYKIIES